MSSGFNKVVILGRVTAEPEQLKTKAGRLFIKATIAVSCHRKSADGVNQEFNAFIPATIFGKTAELFSKYVWKGDMVHLTGRLESNEWKREDGKKGLSLSFLVEGLNLLPNNRTPVGQRVKHSDPDLESEPDDIPM